MILEFNVFVIYFFSELVRINIKICIATLSSASVRLSPETWIIHNIHKISENIKHIKSIFLNSKRRIEFHFRYETKLICVINSEQQQGQSVGETTSYSTCFFPNYIRIWSYIYIPGIVINNLTIYRHQ